jgi:hypothetical protein
MATSLTDIFTLATTPEFRKRVQSALQLAGVEVAAEAIGPYPNAYAKRQAFANYVLKANENLAFQYSLAVATNPVIVLESPDDAIQFTVNSMWDAFSGVTEFDKQASP